MTYNEKQAEVELTAAE